MSEMIPNNPLLKNNELNSSRFVLSLPVVFMLLMFFCTCLEVGYYMELKYVYPDRNWFSGFLFSLFGLFFPELFQMNSKQKAEVHPYFEATTVILTFLLGQLLEAKAHSRTVP
jgi:cation transport ATPase